MSVQKAEAFDFIVNRRGGTVLQHGEDKIRKEITTRFGGKVGTFTFVSGDEIKTAVQDWADKNAGQNRCLVVGGGDGTVLSAVEQVLGRDDVMLGILPLGTQNFVARQLGFSADFKKAAAQYKAGHSTALDVGEVNGQHFLVGMTIDENSLEYFRARENLRDNDMLSAFHKAFAAATGILGRVSNRFTVSADNGKTERKIEGRVIAVTNNSVEPQPVHPLPYDIPSYRDALMQVMGKRKRGAKLSLYVFKGSFIGAPAMLGDVLRGTWDRNKSIEKETAPQFIIKTKEGVVEKPIILDGEIKKVQYPLKVKIIPRGVKLFKPQ